MSVSNEGIQIYKRASKTDIKCSWIKRPKSAPPKKTVTMAEMYPPNQPGYRLLSAYNLEKKAPVQWGVTHEQVCIAEYCKEFGCTSLVSWVHHQMVLSKAFKCLHCQRHDYPGGVFIYQGFLPRSIF
ncbi:hypothetical protein DPMN_005698 [Dreissena polymorpha]|uniref:Uncharacterized protein n=1 Tax=Dreissena polymorpha TaxID=45954 RepID=A0A9D4MU02_DREPO|nr:hypothetical protein DPMN_005698 [Dreissena polymorpha]